MSNGLTKYEVSAVAQKAGCAWLHEPLAQRFAALCRAPLVAEVERLKKMSVANIMVRIVPGYDGGGEEIYAKSVEEVNAVMSDLSQRLDDVETDRDDRKARAEAAEAKLARVREQEPAGYFVPEGWDALGRVTDWAQVVKNQGTPLYATPPQPAAQEPTSAVPVVEQLLSALMYHRDQTRPINTTTEAIAAGQKFIKESGE